jgi:predicted GNAT family acetyltransferase
MTGMTAGDADPGPRRGSARIRISDNTDSRSYDALIDGHIAATIVYEHAGSGRIVFTHTIVEPQFRGQGVGTALTQGALDDVRAKGLTLTNFCDFVARYIQTHPEYLDLLDPQHPGPVLGKQS